MQYSKLGIYLSKEKQAALLNGDTSNTVIHRMFVYQACVFGMLFTQGSSHNQPVLSFHAKYAQSTWEQLFEMQRGNDEILKAQAMLCVCTSCLVFRWIDFGRQYLQKACRIVDSARLRFTPPYGQPLEYSEEVRRRSTVLSQLIYFENYLFLACGRPEPRLTIRMEDEFRRKLQVGIEIHEDLTRQLIDLV